MKKYLVGGAVRDIFMKIPPKDKDYLLVGATPQDIEGMLNEGYIQVGASFPVFLHPETKEEYALARTERKIGLGYSGFEFQTQNVSLEDDLKRRDLTINAIAQDVETNEFIDPFNGIQDIENKVLREVSPAFREDPTRVLRLARFKARFPEFSISESLKKTVLEIKESGELKSLNPLYIKRELEKAFEEKLKMSLFFETLTELGVLGELFPELSNLIGIEQNPIHHPEGDAYVHTLLVVDNIRELSDDVLSFYACLCHDYGKALSGNGTGSHHNHEELGVPLVEKFCKRFQLSSKDTKFIINFTQMHLKIHRVKELRISSVVKLLNSLGKNLELYLKCAKADSLGKNRKDYPQEEFLLSASEFLEENFNQGAFYNHLKEKGSLSNFKEKLHQKKVETLKNFTKIK